MRLKTFGDGVTPNEKCWVGIDQSYSGFAITVLSEDGSYETTVAKFDSSGGERLEEIQEHLLETMHRTVGCCKVQDVAMEGYAYGSIMANKLGELGGVVKLTLHSLNDIGNGKDPLIVPPTSLKKYVTGRGTGVQKNQMLLQVFKKWGVEFPDDNAADSYGLAHIVSGKGSMAYEKEIYDKLNTAESRER
jgi:crossover junction endodeoxyribonuclease RuvC